jgi:hypothetical protein
MSETITSSRSFNNRLIVEAYKKTALQAQTGTGFAYIQQKVAVKGLTVLMDAQLSDGTYIPKGSVAYIKEEALHTQAWAQKILESETFAGQFIIVDISNVEFIVPPGEPAA